MAAVGHRVVLPYRLGVRPVMLVVRPPVVGLHFGLGRLRLRDQEAAASAARLSEVERRRRPRAHGVRLELLSTADRAPLYSAHETFRLRPASSWPSTYRAHGRDQWLSPAWKSRHTASTAAARRVFCSRHAASSSSACSRSHGSKGNVKPIFGRSQTSRGSASPIESSSAPDAGCPTAGARAPRLLISRSSRPSRSTICAGLNSPRTSRYACSGVG